MPRRRSRPLLAALAAVLALASCSERPAPAVAAAEQTLGAPHRHLDGAPPNIVFIVLDTARADRMSYAGHGHFTTPAIDAFARDAVDFRNAHAVAPWTLPSHMSMFTGLLPGEHGATWRAFAEPEDAELRDLMQRALAPGAPERMLPRRLAEAGYSTLGFSSNAWVARRTGFDTGFDAFYEMWRERDGIKRDWSRLPWALRTTRETDLGDAGMVLLRFKEHVLDSGGLREPFFLFFNFIDPHFPYSPPPPWRYAWSEDRELGERIADFEFGEMSLVAGDRPVDVARFSPFYDAELSYADFVVGRLLAWLERTGYFDESLIVITSDHGEHLGEGGRFSHQFSVEEELLHVPLLIRFPHGARSGEVVDSPLVSNLDLYSTILAAAGAAPATGSPALDLSHPDAFSRRFLLAESYYALPYLRAHQKAWSGFDLEAQRVTRRVVFDGTERHVFLQRDGEDPAGPPGAGPESPARAAAAALLRDYVSRLGAGLVRESDRTVDPETLERLRSLGYVQAR